MTQEQPDDNNIEGDKAKFSTPDADWQKVAGLSYKEMKEFFDDEEEKKEGPEAVLEIDEQELAENLASALDFKPERKKIEAGEIILQRNYMPDEAKEAEYLKHNGKPLPAALYNSKTKERIQLPDKIGLVYRHAIRMARARYEDDRDMVFHRNQKTQDLIKNYVTKKLSPDEREKFESNDWAICSLSTRKEYYRTFKSDFEPGGEAESGGEVSEENVNNEETIDSEAVRQAAKLVDFDVLDIDKLTDEAFEAGEEVYEVAEKKYPRHILRKKNTQNEKPENKGENIEELEQMEKEKKPLNALQKIRLALGRAKRSGDYSKVAPEYDEFLTHMNFSLTRRLSVADLLHRFEKGELNEFPKKILSIASGPAGETRAHEKFLNKYKELGLATPEIINLDKEEEMLKAGREHYSKKEEKIFAQENLSASMVNLPFKDGAVDFVENTSLHILTSEKFPKEAVYETIAEMSRVTKEGGLMRLIYLHPFPDKFYKGLEDMGWEFLTPKRARFKMGERMQEIIKLTHGEELMKRANLKIKDSFFVLARKGKPKDEVNPEDLGLPRAEPKSSAKGEIASAEMPEPKPEIKKPRGKRINWEEVARDKSVENVTKELNRREEIFKDAQKNNKLDELRNLFWDFGRAGREADVEYGYIKLETAEAIPTSYLLKLPGGKKFARVFEGFAKKAWPRSRR